MLIPTAVRVPTITIAIEEEIKAYSIAVAPISSFMGWMNLRIIFSFLLV